MASSSEDEVAPEYIMTSRERRANAGNKLKKLLQEELEVNQVRTSGLDDDDLNLLFQEEDDDGDFEVHSKGTDAEDSDEGGQELQDQSDLESAAILDTDMMFSESDSEVEAQEELLDADAGEKELERQNRLKRRKIARKKRNIAVIRKKSSSKAQTEVNEESSSRKRTYEEVRAESLLADERRTSKRSSVIANKMKVYEKLAEAEIKRKQIQERLKKQKENSQKHVLTQEDRLRIAKETEIHNTQSLNLYREQEIYNKQKRLASQQRQKLKFKPEEIILRHLATTWLVTPLMEIEDKAHWDYQLQKRDKKKKKPQKRGPRTHNHQNSSEIKNDKSENVSLVSDSAPIKTESDTESKKSQKAQNHGSENRYVDDHCIDGTTVKENILPEQVTVVEAPLLPNDDENKTPDLVKELITEDSGMTSIQDSEKIANDEAEFKSMTPKQASLTESVESQSIDIKTIQDDINEDKAQSIPENRELDFANKNDDTTTYEGPEQLISKSFITVYKYPDGTISELASHKVLFGEQWSLSTSKPVEVETIFKSVHNNELKPFTSSSIVDDISILDNFPAFGEYDKKVVQQVADSSDKHAVIKLKTEPPSGVFLPNGTRKKCLINDKLCQYFDPKNGVPYSDLDAYKVIKCIQEPKDDEGESTNKDNNDGEANYTIFKWYGFESGGLFLNLTQRPAKGVPDNFA